MIESLLTPSPFSANQLGSTFFMNIHKIFAAVLSGDFSLVLFLQSFPSLLSAHC